jgi:VWFA-related protein
MRFPGIILAIAVAASLHAQTPKQMTVEQLQQTLAGAQAAHLSDNDTARKLADVELTGQLRPAVLQRLLAVNPGPRTTQALRGLSDASLFLDPPATEVPSTPAPDFPAQKAIMARTIHYVARVLPTIPDFMATRVTQHFNDSPQALQPNGWPVRAGMHLDGSFETQISFLDGGERAAPEPAPASVPALKKASSSKQGGNAKVTHASGLNTWGEFRTVLGIVLIDAAQGKVSWGRWERIDGQSAAVFEFQVSRPVSHYDLQFVRNRPNKGAAKPVSNYVFRQTSGYHGHIAVDPATGAVLRVAIEADLDPGSPIHRASMMIEYAPVKMGSRTWICPVHSIAITASDEVFQPTALSPFEDLVELQVNDTTFSGYRRFGSEATIVTGPHAEQPSQASVSVSEPGSTALAPAAASAAGTELAAANAAPPADVIAESAPPPAAETISAEVEKEDQEILIQAIESMPGEADDTAAGDETAVNKEGVSSLTLKSTARLVTVGLLAYDKHGKLITDLKREDIEVYDNGRRQQLSAFHHPAPAASQPAQAPPSPPSATTFTNAVPMPREVQDAPDLLILLLDESHLAYLDLNRARGELLRFLKATRPTSRIAVYSINEHGFRVLQEVTQDHALVMQKLTSWMPSAASVSQAQDVDRRIRQQFDTVHSVTDLDSVNGNFGDNPDGLHTIDPELNLMGQNPLRETLGGMIALSRHFSSVPGHKSMAWIAGDSVLADWTDQAVGIQKGSKQLSAALDRTKEALNDAHIALYVVDASAVSGDGVDPSLQYRNVQLNQAASDNAALFAPPVPRNSANGRTSGQMEQDLHGIQGPVRQLAEATGGRAVNKGGDLKAALDGIDEDSNSLYEVGFDPDTPADGKFHTLQVKIPGRKDVKLRYRTGYLYAEESATTRERFQQAIWSPQDATDLALTAEGLPPAGPSGESSIKLRVNFTGLALEQKPGQRPDRWTDQLYIFVAVRDDATQKAEVSGDTLRLSLRQASYESGMPEGVPYQRAVEVKSRLGSVRVIVVDGNSGKMGSVTLPSSALHP